MARLPITALALLLAAAPAPAVSAGRTVLVDRPTGTGALPFDGAGPSKINAHALSGDGCMLVFESRADALLATDDDAAQNVFRLDRCTPDGVIVQVNTAADGTPAEAGSVSADASVSSDGRTVAFRSNSRVLLAAAGAGTDVLPQVFVKDLQTGAIEIVSRGTGATGAPAAGIGALRGIISGGGNAVLFAATGDLDAENVDGAGPQVNLYLRNRLDGSTRMVSVTTSGAAGGGVMPHSFDIDRTGSRAVFLTYAKLDPIADMDLEIDAYVRLSIGSDVSGSTQRVSSGPATRVAMAPDGGSLAYTGAEFTHAFLAQCSSGCAGANQIDEPKSGGSNARGGIPEVFFPADDGQPTTRLYLLTTEALDPADTDGRTDLYGREIAAPPDTGLRLETAELDVAVTTAAATDSAGVVAITIDGHPHVLARAGGSFEAVSHPSGESARIDDAGSAYLRGSRAMSDDGSVVAFESAAPVFGGSVAQQVLVRNLASGTTILASVAVDGISPANAHVYLGGVDGSGTRVTFATGASNLVAGSGNGRSHVFVRDLATGTTMLVDRGFGGVPSREGATEPRISGDGRRVVFISPFLDVTGNDKRHIYLVDLEDGTWIPVDRTSDGVPGDDQAGWPDIDQTGRRISFVSYADNLGAGMNRYGSVFVRDVQDATTTWVSKPEGSDPAQVFPLVGTAISRDGTRVAFVQADGDFGFGATANTQLFIHDLAEGSTVLASTGPLGAADEGVSEFALSGDGTRAAFTTLSSNFAGSQPGVLGVFLRDLAAGTTSLVSLRDGAATGGRLSSAVPSLNLDGSSTAFQSASDDLVADGYGPDHFHVFVSDAAPLPSDLRLERARFRPAKAAGTAKQQAKRGTAFLFTLSEPAQVVLTIAPDGRCKGKRCGGTLSAAAPAGANRVPFDGRFGRKPLEPGKYVATLVATDVAGQQSTPATTRFKVRR